MIKLSFHALADFMSSSPAKQRKTLFDYKYPDEDEPTAKRLYYRESRDAIRGYHAGSKDSEWLEDKASRLEDLASVNPSKPASVRLKSNSRALRAYARNYDSDAIILSDPFKGSLTYGDIVISVNTDLRGIERKKEKIIRLDYSRDEPDAKYCSIAAQIMFEAACEADIDLPTSAFVIRHIESRTDYTPARKGARILRDIEATCENIQAIWQTL